MTNLTPEALQQKLFTLQDPAYKHFTEKLLPTISPDAIIGVRLPQLRSLAAALAKAQRQDVVLQQLPHRYLEENHLHSFLLDRCCNSYEEALTGTIRFLPYLNNWAVCDSFRPHALRQNLPALSEQIRLWLQSEEPYTVRFALVLLLNWFLTDHFNPEMLLWAAQIRSEEYYVNMAVSWYFSMALVKQPAAALPLFRDSVLPRWVHNKAIQKALESRQTDAQMKAVLRDLKC